MTQHDVHPTAIVSPKAKLGQNVRVGPFTVIYDDVEIADNTIIEGYCEIGVATPLAEGLPLKIGAGARIRSYSVFYQGSTFAAGLVTGHRVTVRERAISGNNLQIGTLSDLQGHCEIGDYVRFHSNVHIGQHSKIGNFVWIFPYVVLTNDPHPPSSTMKGVIVEDFAAIGTMSVVLPGVKVGRDSLVGACSCVNRDVEPDTVNSGNPSKFICSTANIKLKDGSGKAAYPWRRHFHRGYPSEIVEQWNREFS